MTPLKSIGFGFLGAMLAIAAWVAFEATGIVRGPSLNSTVDQRTGEFERRVRDYLLANPRVLIESVQRLQKDQRTAETDEIGQIIAARSDDIFNDPDDPVGGNPNGDVSVVEFFDYNCPYCRRVAPVLAEIEKTDPNLRIVYKEWPILGPNSEFAALAALASHQQGKYFEFHKAMMLAGRLMSEGSVIEAAATVGLDVERLKVDMQAPELTSLIERNRELARALRITGTPSFVIGSEILRGAADAKVIRAMISNAREQVNGSNRTERQKSTPQRN